MLNPDRLSAAPEQSRRHTKLTAAEYGRDRCDKRRFEPALSECFSAVCFLVYGMALRAEFVNLDDDVYVTHNAMVRAGLSPTGFEYAWTTFDTGNWIPLTWLSLELDSTLFGVHPFPFHLTNILLHTGNVLLLFIVFQRMTGAFVRSAILALFFAVHPLHVESVAWVSERKDMVSTAFLLASLLAYERYAARPALGPLVAGCRHNGAGLTGEIDTGDFASAASGGGLVALAKISESHH
jgi:hypothetical protein